MNLEPLRLPWALCALLFLAAPGCGRRGDAERPTRTFLKLGTAPVGGTFYTIGAALAQVLSRALPQTQVTAEATAGTGENVRLLDRRRIDLAVTATPTTYHVVRGLKPWSTPIPLRAVITLHRNASVFVSHRGSGILRIPDLKGKRVAVGPAGAGFEHLIGPVLEVYGMSYASFQPIYQGQADSAELLSDGRVDAAFFSGAIPHPSLLQVATSHPVDFVRVDEDKIAELEQRYPYYFRRTLVRGTYPGQTEDLAIVDIGSGQLVTRPDADEGLIYRVARAIYEHREELAEMHPAGREITASRVAQYEGVPFHPGAIRYFREIGVWREQTFEGESSPSDPPP
ncbi:MAG: TAXI family TRAP transporter solute-binding subunit [Acidobacteria bacterium]|nr:TAXI family TRAP transporter solute-binding subunit [Acidobacteriota bacterium]